MIDNQRLSQELDILSKHENIKKEIPKYIVDNLNPKYKLRPYQIEAIARLIYYLEDYEYKKKPTQLLFNMATGSGKTLLMAANILYLYRKGYRNFLFFVNSTNIIEKTRDNFLNPLSPKYLFNETIKFDDKKVEVREVSNFDEANNEDINIIFTTIQGLHSQLNLFKENSITFEDFKNKKIVLLSDEAHHINASTRNKLNKTENEIKATWEYSVLNILNSNPDNIMIEYTATIDLENSSIYEKYKDKIIFEYNLKQFRIDGYSKEVKVIESDAEKQEIMLQAVIISQYRRKIAEKYRIRLKPVILFKSKNIKESKQNYNIFREKIDNLTNKDLKKIKTNAKGTILKKIFDYFDKENITIDNLIKELKEDFSEEKSILLDSENIDKEKQIKLNTLEAANNRIRVIFSVKMIDEGWDVLNLFDIVRLYDTRDGKWTKDGKYIPGNTTLSEKQLIGRGARYFPFKINEDDDSFKRKFDNKPEHDLKIIEELYYHSKHNPRYIKELTSTLKEYGILPSEEKEITLKVKSSIKKTKFWKEGLIFVNEKVEADRSSLKNLHDIAIAKSFKYNLASGFVNENTVLNDNNTKNNTTELTSVTYKLSDFGKTVLRKAMAKLDFYKFNNLKKYFPSVNSSAEFIESLKDITVGVTSSREKLNKLTQEDKLNISLNVLVQLENEVLNEYVQFKGTHEFMPVEIKKIVKDKKLKIKADDYGDNEYSTSTREAKQKDIRLNLAEKDWYVYNENFGTSEEKSFVKFIDGIIEKLKAEFNEVYLIRNANLFKIYRFSDGKAIEPNLVLFLRKERAGKTEQIQLFIETKENHLIKTNQWKEDFLMEIEEKYKIEADFSGKNKKYRIIGLPFYNENRKNQFIEILEEKLGLNLRG